MTNIDHIAIYAQDLENLRSFYITYFGAVSNDIYHNKNKGFKSYFLSFQNGTRLEIMSKDSVKDHWPNLDLEYVGLSHFAISVGSKEAVDSLTKTLQKDGYQVIGQPRTTGDGYYESLVFDPEKNRIEIII